MQDCAIYVSLAIIYICHFVFKVWQMYKVLYFDMP